MTTPEIHLFVLWDRVGTSRETVLQRINTEFDILRVFRIRWSPSLFSSNLSRFYGQNLPAGCNKEESCGTGPFTLIVVRDSRPNYALRETTRGRALVNVRTLDIKTFFRSPAGGCLPIHATDAPREAAHDLALLLGVGSSVFETTYPGHWNGEVVALRRDISGAHGWESLGEFFTVLNETINYVVLRNFEGIPDQRNLESHGDIDLLVGNYADACLVANATPVFHDPCRVHRAVVIGNESVPFDFRYIGDDYYDESWQHQILESRVFTQNDFFAPNAENHFYSLLYHAAVHKPAIARDYADRLSALATQIGIPIKPDALFDDPQKIRAFLLGYMKRHGYRFTRPQDRSVYFNTAVALNPMERVADMILPRKNQDRHPPQVQMEHTVPARNLSDECLTGAARANLLRPFGFGPEQRVLELGCEAGVITRHIGESGASVVAVESNPKLAAIAEERCRDLANVRVICDDPYAAEVHGQFDVVTLIGTPEHVAVCQHTDNPLGVFLERAAAWLKEDGLLILAIDNQFGLKYFNGCPEDRTRIPYFGINGLYGSGDPATFGRHVLSEKLRSAGFQSHEFFFPFPDFRLPSVILSEAGLQDSRLNVADMLINNTGRGYPETHHRAFAEDMAWQIATENRLLADLANSFLILARPSGSTPPQAAWLAKIYSRGRRCPPYQVESTIAPDEVGTLEVRKRKLFPDAAADGEWIRHNAGDSTYLTGKLLVGNIHRAMARNAGLDEFALCFGPWLDFLLAHSTANENGEQVVPGHFVDCIPANLIETPSGELRYFDAEWVCTNEIPLVWPVVRGVVYSLIDCLENSAIGQMTYRNLISTIAEKAGIRLSRNDFAVADHCEIRLIAQCDMSPDKRPKFADLLDSPIRLVSRLENPAADYRDSLAWHRSELARVKRTVSWRITAPLRVAWNLFHRLATPRR